MRLINADSLIEMYKGKKSKKALIEAIDELPTIIFDGCKFCPYKAQHIVMAIDEIERKEGWNDEN